LDCLLVDSFLIDEIFDMEHPRVIEAHNVTVPLPRFHVIYHDIGSFYLLFERGVLLVGENLAGILILLESLQLLG
jgi:hypothetical protein